MALTALFVLWGVGAARAGEEVVIDGVTHVKNPADPPQGRETMQLEELWRAGGADEDATVFGIIVQTETDAEGNLYLLDLQLSQVFVFSPDGRMLRTLSREGEGPGETRSPADMFFLPDGTLGLVQVYPGRVVKLNLDDTPAGDVTLRTGSATEGGIVTAIDGGCRGGNMVFAGAFVTFGDVQGRITRTSFLASFAEDGLERARYWEMGQELDFTNLRTDERDQYNVFPRRWDIAANGDVYAGTERDAYVVKVFAPDGTLKRVIEKEFVNRKRTDEELELYQRIVAAQTANLPGEPKVEIADTPEAIQGVEMGPDGTVWVTSSRGNHDLPEGILTIYDVFDAQGHYLKQVAVACDGDGQEDGLVRVSEDRMIKIVGFMPALMSMQTGGASVGDDEEPAPMEVICYKIKS